MIALPQTVTLPLKADEHDVIYVSGTKVTLDTIIACHLQGDTPEAVHQGFPTVPLTDIYTVIAYYLAHQEEVDAYLIQRDQAAEQVRREIESRYSPQEQDRTEHFRQVLAQKRQNPDT
jgi:uncharacterized protein (DUF433 family)